MVGTHSSRSKLTTKAGAMASRENERKRREWTERLVRYRAGGLTVARFCAQKRVSVHPFYYWSRRGCSDATENTVCAGSA